MQKGKVMTYIAGSRSSEETSKWTPLERDRREIDVQGPHPTHVTLQALGWKTATETETSMQQNRAKFSTRQPDPWGKLCFWPQLESNSSRISPKFAWWPKQLLTLRDNWHRAFCVSDSRTTCKFPTSSKTVTTTPFIIEKEKEERKAEEEEEEETAQDVGFSNQHLTQFPKYLSTATPCNLGLRKCKQPTKPGYTNRDT